MKLFSNNDAFFFHTNAQLGQMRKIRQIFNNLWNWRNHYYACNSLINFQYQTHAMTGNGNKYAKTCLEKLMKSLQAQFIFAGFSHLEQLWYVVSPDASVVAASVLETPAAISSALYRSSSPLVCRPAETLLVCIWYAKEVHSRFELHVGHAS